ncbi:hypothetical protein Q3G72_021679 [Acer saccharum]|nr:hypothetical protein Q3G72_021679 [Acer saccharum]
MDFVGPILEILKCTCPPICKCIEYHRKLEEYKVNLENTLVELKSQKRGIELRLEAERGFDKLPKEEVKSWLENIQMIIDDAEKVEQTFKKKCFSRARLAKLVEKKIQKVKEWYEKGTSLSSFNSLVIDAPPPVGITFPTTGLAGETTAKKNEEEILGHLMAIRLEELGIPEPTEESRCKLVITTRSLDVCRSMGCTTVQVKPLSEKEALELFYEKAELDISKVPTLEETVELMVKQCAEGLVDEMVNLQATEDRARIIIKSLVSNCLLLESLDDDGISCVKLHDVVRDMALKHITSKSPLFMVKAGMKLKEFPSGKEWKENLDKVSLMFNFIREIPSSLSPNCPILSTLFLQHNPLKSIPESFFTHMHGLKILNLSRTWIESLPNSISEMTNLTALFLQYCRQLKHVPCLARLQALEKLELGYTAINEVPTGMEMLANLTSLDLFSLELHKIPAGILSKLCRLQKLQINWGLETQIVAIEEGTRLKNLNSLTALFLKLQDFNCYMKSLNTHGILGEYSLFLCLKDIEAKAGAEDIISIWKVKYDVNKLLFLAGCNIYGREEDSIVLPKEVEFLFIIDCNTPAVDEKGQASPPPALIKIKVEREWWEALEWDHHHPHAQTLLLPFCEFLT